MLNKKAVGHLWNKQLGSMDKDTSRKEQEKKLFYNEW